MPIKCYYRPSSLEFLLVSTWLIDYTDETPVVNGGIAFPSFSMEARVLLREVFTDYKARGVRS